MENTPSIVESREEKIKKWLSDKYNVLFLALIVLTIGIKLYYFALTANQPIWWDEGDYLGVATVYSIDFPEKPEWWGHFTAIRPPLMPLVWATFINLGISEETMRFLTEIVPSVFIVIFVYLLGASLFNRKVGLIAGYITTFYWVLQFYGLRFLTDIPTVLLALMSVYFFWEYYEKRGKNFGLYLSVLFGVLSFYARFPSALILMSIAAFIIFKRKLKILTSKEIWIAAALGIILLSPYFIYNKFALGSFFPAGSFYGAQNLTVYNEPAWFLLSLAISLIGKILAVFLAIGAIYALFQLIVSADVVMKKKSPLDNHLFIIIWMVFQLAYYLFIIKTGNDRWILLWMPPIFFYAAIGLSVSADFLKKYHKTLGTILIIVVMSISLYPQITQADSLVRNKLDSYKEVKDIGLWLKENTPPDAKIMGASVVQNTYYSQRRTYDFYLGTEFHNIILNGVVDPNGRVIGRTYQAIRNETELECKFLRIKPDYLILHPWEPEFTPQFMYDYPQRHPELFEPIKAFERGGQITGAIYKLKAYPSIDESKVNCTWVYERSTNITGLPLSIESPYKYAIPM